MKEKDHIEDYFKKYLEHYEESPDEDFWAKVAPAIEVQKERNNRKLLWILLLLLGLLLTGFLVKSLAWDQYLEFKKEKEHVPIAIDDVQIDDAISTNKPTPILRAEQPIQKEEKLVTKTQETQDVEAAKSDLVIEKENVGLLPQVLELKNQKIMDHAGVIENNIPTIQPLKLELLPDKITDLNYIAPELPELRRPFRIQPYVSLHSYQLQSVTYEGIQQVDGEIIDRQLSQPINTILNFGIDAGVALNEQFYIQVGFNQDYGEFTYKGTVNQDLSEQDIAILFDGVPINFDFMMDIYFDEIEGKLKLTPKTTEIEAGNKTFSIEARRKVQTTRWTIASAYKLDVSNVIRLIPKIGMSKVVTQYLTYEQLSGEEKLLGSNGQIVESQLNVETWRTSVNKEIRLKNIEGIFGFQAEIPLDRQRKWLLIPTGELWFDWKPSLERTDLTLKKNALVLGAGLRYNIK